MNRQINRRDFNKVAASLPFFPLLTFKDTTNNLNDELSEYCWSEILKSDIFKIFTPVYDKLEFEYPENKCCYTLHTNKRTPVRHFGGKLVKPEIHNINIKVQWNNDNNRQELCDRALVCLIDNIGGFINRNCWNLLKMSSKDYTIYTHKFSKLNKSQQKYSLDQQKSITDIYISRIHPGLWIYPFPHQKLHLCDFLDGDGHVGLNLSDRESTFILPIKNKLKVEKKQLGNGMYELFGQIDIGFLNLQEERAFYIDLN